MPTPHSRSIPLPSPPGHGSDGEAQAIASGKADPCATELQFDKFPPLPSLTSSVRAAHEPRPLSGSGSALMVRTSGATTACTAFMLR